MVHFIFLCLSIVSQVVSPQEQFHADVNDPMLKPIAVSEHQISSWDEALTTLKHRSTDLQTALAAVQRTEGRWRQALGSLLPNARTSVGVLFDFLNPDAPVLTNQGGTGGGVPNNINANSPTSPIGTATLSLSQSLVDISAWRNLSANKAAEQRAKALTLETKRTLTQGLARQLIAVVAAERAAELNRVGLQQALERLALTQRIFELGATTELDVVRVKQDVEIARSALIAGDEQLRRMRDALGLTLGFDHDVGVSTTFKLDGLVNEARATCSPLQNPSERKDIIAAEQGVYSAKLFQKQAQSGYIPTLNLTSTAFAYTTQGDAHVRAATWNIMGVLTIPLWEGGFREGLVKERAADKHTAEQTLESLRRFLGVEVLRARRTVSVASDLKHNAEASRDLAERVDHMTRRSFQVGRATSLELVQSGAALRQAELNLTLREFELVQGQLDAYLTEAQCDW